MRVKCQSRKNSHYFIYLDHGAAASKYVAPTELFMQSTMAVIIATNFVGHPRELGDDADTEPPQGQRRGPTIDGGTLGLSRHIGK